MTDPRDWFPSEEEPNPMRAAQAGMKPTLPKRFYKNAGVEERDGRFLLTLDGRTAKTPGKQDLAAPTRELAEALAEEWQGQGAEIDPSTMPITRIVNSAIDGVTPRQAEVVDDLVRYAGSDLVYYRAGEPERLARSQDQAWSPVLDWAREAHGARFTLGEGVMHVAQPDDAVAAIRSAIEQVRSPFALAALHVMTTLSGSVLIALAHAAQELDVDRAWAAAHVDELYQESVWGEDYEAMERRRRREADFKAASTVYRLATR
ncbi:ATP12 family chaperone protein [Microvirga sp. CF3016]|uniref:ATP12 family chaperone protein n=1 Tax=Microvirga sp. CF3016 TaxID=3110181 RepID=UPI002E7710E3|nr:ATP12 family protein [Microvirga sp. CF3016]MEE1613926.1 ATP12 family protein [Microvirga sp. CF3016]